MQHTGRHGRRVGGLRAMVSDPIGEHMHSLAGDEAVELVAQALAQHDGVSALGLEAQLDQPAHPPRLGSSELIETSGVEVHHGGATSCASGKQEGGVSQEAPPVLRDWEIDELDVASCQRL